MVRFFRFPKAEVVVSLSIHAGMDVTADLALARVLLLPFLADQDEVTEGNWSEEGFLVAG